jgi:hypothetical protein
VYYTLSVQTLVYCGCDIVCNYVVVGIVSGRSDESRMCEA